MISAQEADASYRSTDVDVEIVPGRWVRCGPEHCPPELLQLGPAHVITAWNPFPSMLAVEVNRARQELLIAEIAQVATVVRPAIGVGRGDDPHREESVAAWGLDRETALATGRRHGQRAIFELSSSGLRVLGC